MKSTRVLAAAAATLWASISASASEPVKLADYAFDFPTYGYEITVAGKTRNFMDKLTADDHIILNDNGYDLKTLIDRMGRKDRQQFIAFFNKHCVVGFGGKKCSIAAAGDIELDKKMCMIFRIRTAKISMGGSEWTNMKPE